MKKIPSAFITTIIYDLLTAYYVQSTKLDDYVYEFIYIHEL